MANANQAKIDKIDEAIVLLYGDGNPSEENLQKIKILADEKKSLKLIPEPKPEIEKKANFKDAALATLGIQNIQKNDQGQNIVNLGYNPLTSGPLEQTALKAASNIVRGVGSLPFDLYVEFDENQILNQKAGQTNLTVASIHSNEQLLSYVNSKEYKFLLKINLPFVIDSNVSLLMSPSCYHFNQLNILSGIINSKYKRDINFFIPIKKNQNELYLKQGEALFLLTPLCENKIKINFKPMDKIYPNLTFRTLKQHILKNLT